MRNQQRNYLRILYRGLVAVMLLAALCGALLIRRMHTYDALYVEMGRKYNVDPRLISAVIWKESRSDPSQVGAAGEIGLMQVTEVVGKEWAEAIQRPAFTRDDLFRPDINVAAGAWYLGQALSDWEKCRDPVPFALAQYNAGPSNARRWAEESGLDAHQFVATVSYPTTRRYILDILMRYRGGL
jgi:soluble lytic murein transglycosylase